MNAADKLNNFRMSDCDETIRHLLDIQGGAERIKKTPFPPVYGFVATRLTQLYACILPFCLVDQITFWVIPANLVICMSFQLINEVGRVLENPSPTIGQRFPSPLCLSPSNAISGKPWVKPNLPPAQQPITAGKARILM